MSVVVMGPVMGCAFDRLIFRHIPNSNSHGEAGVQPRPAGRDPLAAAGDLRAPEPRRHGDDLAVLQPERRVLHHRSLGTPINGIYLATISVTVVVLDPAHDPPALHEPGPADAGRGGEPAPGPARRGQRQRRRGRRLDRLELHGRAWPASSWPRCIGAFNSDEFVTLTVTAIAAAAWALLRSLPIAAGVAVLIGVVTTVLQGYIPPNSFLNAAVVPSLPVLRHRGRPAHPAGACATWTPAGIRWPPSTPHPPPIAATTRAPEHGPDHPDPVVGGLGGLLRLHADVDPDHLGDRLQQRPDPTRSCCSRSR